MFPDSEIAKSYSQGETKVKYVIQFGIVPYIKQLILGDIKGKPFSFLFDETNTQQVKKQFDAYLQYLSSENQISNIYAGSCFVGHCNSDQLFDHFHHFIKGLELNPNLLLHLGMDGPNENLKFQQDLAKYFDKKSVSFLNINTCLLHKVHGLFKHGVKSLPVDIDQFAVDLHGFLAFERAKRGLQRNRRRYRCYCSLCL